MLPLEKPTPEILAAMAEKGLTEDAVYAMVSLDLNFDGSCGECWLILEKDTMRMHRFSSSGHVSENEKYPREPGAPRAAFDAYTVFDIKGYTGWYVDNCPSTNRLLARVGAPFVPDPELSYEDNREKQIAYTKDLPTEGIACFTNGNKNRLFAFLSILERLQDGVTLADDDELFEQFNPKCPKCGRPYENPNRRVCKHCANHKAILTRLLQYCADYKWQFAVAFLCMILQAGISLLNPILSGKLLFDQVITPPSEDGTLGRLHEEKWVFIVVGLILGMALFSLFVSVIRSRNTHHMSAKITQRLKMEVFTALQNMSLSYFGKNNPGSLVHRVDSDAGTLRSFIVDHIPTLVINVLQFVGVTVFLLVVNWKLTLIVFLPIPIILFILRVVLPRFWRFYGKIWRTNNKWYQGLNDSLSGIRVVKVFAKEVNETFRFHKASDLVMKTYLELNRLSLFIWPVISLLIGMAGKAVWGFGGVAVMDKQMTYGEFTAYFGYLGMIFGPLNYFSSFADVVTNVFNSAQRMFETLDEIPDITDVKDPIRPDRIRGELEFKRVCFHYTPNRPILKDVTFHIKAGQSVGLVGHTGSGKSTIANLITRMYDVISGSVEIDGVNVKQLASESLRRNIAIVSQEIFLFRGTIAENIRYAKPDATMDEVIEAARAANAHDFIMSLPEGYETVVGAGSRSLSGGERQRISIARALLLDPSILILDEATAAMDTETERQIQMALDRLSEGRTTISIAHRLSTLRNCDFLMVVENGCVHEIGTHAELVARKGTYYRLYKLQAESMKRVLQGM